MTELVMVTGAVSLVVGLVSSAAVFVAFSIGAMVDRMRGECVDARRQDC